MTLYLIIAALFAIVTFITVFMALMNDPLPSAIAFAALVGVIVGALWPVILGWIVFEIMKRRKIWKSERG